MSHSQHTPSQALCGCRIRKSVGRRATGSRGALQSATAVRYRLTARADSDTVQRQLSVPYPLREDMSAASTVRQW